jgi:signal transduction histidine kinase
VDLARSSKAAYVAASLACALPAVVGVIEGDLSGWRAAAWFCAAAVFAALFGVFLRRRADAPGERGLRYSLAVQTLAAFVMVLASDGLSRYTSAVALLIVVQELPSAYSQRAAWLWVGAQSALLAAVFWYFDGWLGGLSGGGAHAGIQVFAFGKALLERSEHAAREDLSRVNAELHATRALLAENSRAEERLRISRDLHDTLGHHLTALSIRLEVAARRSNGEAAEHLDEARAITRLLLGDVRDVVGRLREHGRSDIAEAVRALAATNAEPQVHFDLPEVLYVDEEALANALLRCAQEIITNAARHAGARNVWLRIAVRDDGIELRAHDDGHGMAKLVTGHGLRGMRERFDELGGHVEFATSPGSGFAVHAFLPHAARARP